MSEAEPDPEAWQKLFASLCGDPAVDAAVVRTFCNTYSITTARLMDEMHARGQAGQRNKNANADRSCNRW